MFTDPYSRAAAASAVFGGGIPARSRPAAVACSTMAVVVLCASVAASRAQELSACNPPRAVSPAPPSHSAALRRTAASIRASPAATTSAIRPHSCSAAADAPGPGPLCTAS
jgi:hypothetical protein